MDSHEIEQLRERHHLPAEPRSWHLVGRFFLLCTVLSASVIGIFSAKVTIGSDGSEGLFPEFSLMATLKDWVTPGTSQLRGEAEDRVNILLLGVGGAGHDGPQLSDTLMLASFRPSDERVALLSIPRDLHVPIPGYDWKKINHANAYGEERGPGRGPELASEVIKTVFDEPIHYFVRIDFRGFAAFIDAIGGINVTVENSFTDPAYPIEGKEEVNCGTTVTNTDVVGEAIEVPDYRCRFESLSFQKGTTQMDGKTALAFVRSRHGNNGEGSDFARARRQRQVLLAVKDRLLSASTLLNPNRIAEIQKTLRQHISTNLEGWEVLRFASMLREFDQEKISHTVLDTSPGSPLYATNVGGAYVLKTHANNWNDLRDVANTLFDTEGIATTQTPPPAKTPTSPTKKARVGVLNGTFVPGLAARNSEALQQEGFLVSLSGNAPDRTATRTVVYVLQPKTTTLLAELSTFTERIEPDLILFPDTEQLFAKDMNADELKQARSSFSSLQSTYTNVDFLLVAADAPRL